MKLPQEIQGIHREGRTDSLTYTTGVGVEPLFLGKVWNWVKPKIPSLACMACNAIPNATAKAACQAIACR